MVKKVSLLYRSHNSLGGRSFLQYVRNFSRNIATHFSLLHKETCMSALCAEKGKTGTSSAFPAHGSQKNWNLSGEIDANFKNKPAPIFPVRERCQFYTKIWRILQTSSELLPAGRTTEPTQAVRKRCRFLTRTSTFKTFIQLVVVKDPHLKTGTFILEVCASSS